MPHFLMFPFEWRQCRVSRIAAEIVDDGRRELRIHALKKDDIIVLDGMGKNNSDEWRIHQELQRLPPVPTGLLGKKEILSTNYHNNQHKSGYGIHLYDILSYREHGPITISWSDCTVTISEQNEVNYTLYRKDLFQSTQFWEVVDVSTLKWLLEEIFSEGGFLEKINQRNNFFRMFRRKFSKVDADQPVVDDRSRTILEEHMNFTFLQRFIGRHRDWKFRSIDFYIA